MQRPVIRLKEAVHPFLINNQIFFHDYLNSAGVTVNPFFGIRSIMIAFGI